MKEFRTLSYLNMTVALYFNFPLQALECRATMSTSYFTSSISTHLDMLEFTSSPAQKQEHHSEDNVGQVSAAHLDSDEQIACHAQYLHKVFAEHIPIITDSSTSAVIQSGTSGLDLHNGAVCPLSEVEWKGDLRPREIHLSLLKFQNIDQPLQEQYDNETYIDDLTSHDGTQECKNHFKQMEYI